MRSRADVQSCRRASDQQHVGTLRFAQGRPSASRHDTPQLLERMVIIAEDSRFKTHHGIDFVELHDAWASGGHRGASTITQQLAKNFYLSPSRSIFRKLKEAVTAVRLELVLSKDRIMELYLDNAELGPGVWGVDAASKAYFGVSAARLSPAQAAALAATLPQPRTSNPTFRPARMLARRDLILARYYGGKTPVPHIDEESIPNVPVIEPPVLPPILDSVTRDTTKDHPASGGPSHQFLNPLSVSASVH
ncbi:MAG TPA: biosynthetic peptidoglycan transglycosylase [Gemmatimonadales bacterium]|nr:biosynthetic peptidoglycan transglycosylase [Gemmatimonadales bacterium]